MNERGVSVTINYVLTLAITTLLMSGLLIGTGAMLDTRQEVAVRAELDVLGQRLAAGLMTADRLVQAGGDNVSVRVELPGRVAGTNYDIEVNATAGGAHLLLESHDPVTSANVTFTNRTAVESLTITGGDVRVVLTDDGNLEVETA